MSNLRTCRSYVLFNLHSRVGGLPWACYVGLAPRNPRTSFLSPALFPVPSEMHIALSKSQCARGQNVSSTSNVSCVVVCFVFAVEPSLVSANVPFSVEFCSAAATAECNLDRNGGKAPIPARLLLYRDIGSFCRAFVSFES